MSVTDYRCAYMNCGEVAVAVRQTAEPCAFYGECAEHLKPLDYRPIAGKPPSVWLWPPPDDLLRELEKA